MSDERSIQPQSTGAISLPGQPSRLLSRGLQHLTRRSQLVDLGAFCGGNSAATDINNSGQVCGWRETAEGVKKAVLWNNGHAVDLGTLGGSESVATAINNHGQIIGESRTADGQRHGFIWTDGQMHPLRLPVPRVHYWRKEFAVDPSYLSDKVMTFVHAIDINDRGQVVGHSYHSWGDWLGDNWGDARINFLWESSKVIVLHSHPHAINNSGQIIGHADVFRKGLADLVWSDGLTVELATDESLGRRNLSILQTEYPGATNINNQGQMVGFNYRTGAGAYLFDGERSVDLGLLDPGLRCTWPTGINTHTQVVGWAAPASSDLHNNPAKRDAEGKISFQTYWTKPGDHSSDEHRAAPFLWTDGRMEALDSLVADDDNYFDRPLAVYVSESFPFARGELVINDKGQVAGNLFTQDGMHHAFMWA